MYTYMYTVKTFYMYVLATVHGCVYVLATVHGCVYIRVHVHYGTKRYMCFPKMITQILVTSILAAKENVCICCSAQTGQHEPLQGSCCPVWALQQICWIYMYIPSAGLSLGTATDLLDIHVYP